MRLREVHVLTIVFLTDFLVKLNFSLKSGMGLWSTLSWRSRELGACVEKWRSQKRRWASCTSDTPSKSEFWRFQTGLGLGRWLPVWPHRHPLHMQPNAPRGLSRKWTPEPDKAHTCVFNTENDLIGNIHKYNVRLNFFGVAILRWFFKNLGQNLSALAISRHLDKEFT